MFFPPEVYIMILWLNLDQFRTHFYNRAIDFKRRTKLEIWERVLKSLKGEAKSLG